MKQKKEVKVRKTRDTGITLVALVVTIIILIILATISIRMVVGEGGIIWQANNAKVEHRAATVDEEILAWKAEKQMTEYTDGIKPQERDTLIDDQLKRGLLTEEEADTAKKVGQVKIGSRMINYGEEIPETVQEATDKNYKFEDNTDIIDEFGNPVTIPAGFHIVMPSEDNTVEYNYSTENSGIPTVQDGIVVEDENDNQFVWIPVGEIKDRDGEKTTIILGRYSFDVTFKKDSIPIGEGTESIVQSADKYNEDASQETYKDYRIYYDDDNPSLYFYEPVTGEQGNTKAKDLDGFINSATNKGGYYLARYEAGKGLENKLVSKRGTVWHTITQPEAAIAAQEMYTSNEFTSDLTNSYAWDTAIVFIQTYSGDADYSKEIGQTFSSNIRDTGTTDNEDKKCNIYDMASNCSEWTTETCCKDDYPCVIRGGLYPYKVYYTCWRGGYKTDYCKYDLTFRSVLYVK